MTSVNQEQASGSDPASPPYPAAMTISGNAWHSSLVPTGPVPLVHPETYIGLLDSNDIVLHDSAASRIHAVIRWTAEGYAIQDLGSRTGTLINGREIEGESPLNPGEQLRVGGTDMLFQAVRIQQKSDLGTNPELVSSNPLSLQSIHTRQPIESAMEAAMSVETITSAIHHAHASSYGRWFSEQLPRQYWRIFLIGLVAYIGASRILNSTHNTNLLPLVMILGSVLVPVTFVVFCWEQRAFADFPPTVVGLAFVVGATVGLLLSAILEPKFVTGTGFWAAIVIAIIEETAKAAAALWFLGDNRRYREFDGLVLGAAVGMGFAALETAGYGFSFFLYGFVNEMGVQNASYADLLNSGISEMVHVLDVRMLLAAFGHGVWTAIICATIWRERRESTAPRLMSSFVPAYAISVLLSNLWGATPGGGALGRAVDRSLANLRITSSVIAAYAGVVLLHTMWNVTASYPFYFLYGFIGLFILRFLIEESLDRARLGMDAPPPPPLLLALLAYAVRMFRRIHRPVAEAIAFATAAEGGLSAAMTRLSTSAGPVGGTINPSGTINPPTAGIVDPNSTPETQATLPIGTVDASADASATVAAPRDRNSNMPRPCRTCGLNAPATAKFCPSCGAEMPR